MVSSESYAELYEVKCEYNDWRPYANYLWMARSGCDLPFEVQCQLDAIYDNIDTQVPDQTQTITCQITITEVDEPAVCTTGILIRTIQ